MQEVINDNELKQQETTNWKAWYWGLMIFLAVQIGLYVYITNLYTV